MVGIRTLGRWAVIAGVLSLFSLGGVAAVAAAPTASPLTVTSFALDRALEVLNDPARTDEEKRERIRREVVPSMDFSATARLALGRHRPPSEAARQEFERLFVQLLEQKYLTKMLFAEAKGARVVYFRETIDGNFAQVPTKFISAKGGEHSVIWRLHVVDDSWRIYDMVAEGVSLVANYRAQFTRLLKSSAPAESVFEEFLSRIRAALGRATANR
ncbi:MAG: ABC transporter substrate-binding protein [bacterium]|nr:ABC transporter substrate-binding protein [bacterium]